MQKSNSVPGLDLLRAFAVIWVWVFHYSIQSVHAPLRGLGEFGWMGVDLFFVLSGYLIAHQLFRLLVTGHKLNLKSFYLRRFLRTLPLYYAVLIVYMAFPSLRESAQMAPGWRFFSFTLNLGLDRKQTGAFTHAWSLSVEEQFYFMLPLATLGLTRARRPQRLVAVLVVTLFFLGILGRSLVWFCWVKPVYLSLGTLAGSFYAEYLYYPTYARLDGLLAGVGLALIRNFKPELWRKMMSASNQAFALGSGCLVAAIYLSDTQFTWAHSALAYPLIALGFAGWLIGCISPQSLMAQVRIPGMGTVATLSYALYLVQKIVFHQMKWMLPRVSLDPFSYLGFFLTLIACILVALMAHVLVERPFLIIRDRRLTHEKYRA